MKRTRRPKRHLRLLLIPDELTPEKALAALHFEGTAKHDDRRAG